MPVTVFKKAAIYGVVIAGLAIAGALASGSFMARAAETVPAPLTKADVEKIVHEYILSNPDVIINAVQDYQTSYARERRETALKDNHKDLYNDAGTPVLGNPNGDVTLVEFSDYNCGYCKKVFPMIAQLLEEDKNLRVILKEFPILGPTSETASKWALAAHKQGKYLDYHRALMDNNKPINDDLLAAVAAEVGLDVDQARRDVDSTDVMIQIERNRSLAMNMELRGTPAFIIGDEVLPGAVGLDDMKEMIAKARGGDKEKKAE